MSVQKYQSLNLSMDKNVIIKNKHTNKCGILLSRISILINVIPVYWMSTGVVLTRIIKNKELWFQTCMV